MAARAELVNCINRSREKEMATGARSDLMAGRVSARAASLIHRPDVVYAGPQRGRAGADVCRPEQVVKGSNIFKPDLLALPCIFSNNLFQKVRNTHGWMEKKD